MTPESRPARTLWERIRDTVAGEIDAGQYPPGAKLPTEAALSQRFGVNRHTVRRALEALELDGRIHVRRGSGSFVTQGRFDYPISPTTRLSRNLAELGLTPGRRHLRLETLPAGPREARSLAIAEGAPVVVNETVGEADGVPIVYGHHYYPAERLPGIAEALAEEGGVTAALARVGHGNYRRTWTRLLAERPGALIARHLRMTETHPVLFAESLNVDAEGVPIQLGHAWFCSDRVQLFVEGTNSHNGTNEGVTG